MIPNEESIIDHLWSQCDGLFIATSYFIYLDTIPETSSQKDTVPHTKITFYLKHWVSSYSWNVLFWWQENYFHTSRGYIYGKTRAKAHKRIQVVL